MVTLVVEDGTGLSTANTYISNADADTYFGSHLYATDWTGASEANQDIALAHATRELDDYIKFEGTKATETQALQWPRYDIHIDGYYVENTTIPQQLKDATAEYAKWLLNSDRTAEEDTLGFTSLSAGSLRMDIDPGDRKSTIPKVVQQMLSEIGGAIGSGTAKVTR
jgi:hypothetical protein